MEKILYCHSDCKKCNNIDCKKCYLCIAPSLCMCKRIDEKFKTTKDKILSTNEKTG